MSLDQILEKLVREVHGALGAIFIDRDGEAISHYTTLTSERIKLMGAYYGILWLQVENLTDRFFRLSGAEIVFWMEKGICLMKPLEKDYLVFLVLEPSGSVGQARRWLGWASAELRKEI
jgi:predicted regulator of Ras-like GTPase activity (Roadblock/LC7/MglB family)